MPFLRSVPEDAVLVDVFKRFPDTVRPLLDYHEAVMRKVSPLSAAERELIAAYVSGVNACHYCQGVHTAVAQQFGVASDVLQSAMEDLDSSEVDEKLKPILRYVGKLTRTPSRVTSDDADEVLDAGWDEQALHDAVAVCALFNMMNRFVEGLGLTAGPGYFALSGERLSANGYAGLADVVGLD